jgi:hypothetical protein
MRLRCGRVIGRRNRGSETRDLRSIQPRHITIVPLHRQIQAIERIWIRDIEWNAHEGGRIHILHSRQDICSRRQRLIFIVIDALNLRERELRVVKPVIVELPVEAPPVSIM